MTQNKPFKFKKITRIILTHFDFYRQNASSNHKSLLPPRKSQLRQAF